MSQPLNVAVLGYGFMGKAHANAYRKVNQFFPDLEHRPVLKCLCARDAEKAGKFGETWGFESIESDWRKVIERDDIDVVDICVPNNLHRDIAMAAAAKGKWILCEKPFTQNATDAICLVDAAQKNDILIAEAFKFRHHPMHLKAKDILESGDIGRAVTVRSTFCTSSGAPVADRKPELNWRWNKAKGGGSIYDLACYNIHHARWIFGADPIEVFATQRPGIEVDDGANIQFVFPNGGIAQITVGFDTYQSQEFEILGTSGSLRTDRAWNNENRPIWLDRISKGLEERHHFDPAHQFTLQLEHVCDVLDGKTSHRIPPENSIGQMRTIDAIYESFDTRKAVKL